MTFKAGTATMIVKPSCPNCIRVILKGTTRFRILSLNPTFCLNTGAKDPGCSRCECLTSFTTCSSINLPDCCSSCREFLPCVLTNHSCSGEPLPFTCFTVRLPFRTLTYANQYTEKKLRGQIWLQQSRAAPNHGQLYFQKVAKNFGQSDFLSAREIEHGRFRALFAGGFALRYKMVELHPKNKKKHSAVSLQH